MPSTPPLATHADLLTALDRITNLETSTGAGAPVSAVGTLPASLVTTATVPSSLRPLTLLLLGNDIFNSLNKADLDANGRVPLNQLPDSVTGAARTYGRAYVANNTPTTAAMSNFQFDTILSSAGGAMANSGGRTAFTAPSAGLYTVHVSFEWTGVASGDTFDGTILVNGTPNLKVMRITYGQNHPIITAGNGTLNLSAGDVVTVQVLCSGSRSVLGSSNPTSTFIAAKVF